MNPIFKVDSYKLPHIDMFVPGTNLVYSHVTPRSNKYLKKQFPDIEDSIVVFGTQYLVRCLKEDWDTNFFNVPWEQIKEEAHTIFGPHLGYVNTQYLDKFQQLHSLGYLPLKIKSLEEGTLVELNVPILTIVNTQDEFFWLTNYLESYILSTIYKPLTVATIARHLAKIRNKYYELTCNDNDPSIDFALHDFSYRGHADWQGAMAASMALSLYTKGTDTVVGLVGMKKYYDATETCYSINATEHSVTSQGILWYGKELSNLFFTESDDSELAHNFFLQESSIKELRTLVYTYVNMFPLETFDEREKSLGELINLYRLLVEVYPTGILAYVSDTFNLYTLVNRILLVLKDVILKRNGKLVIRPDSGDPLEVVLGLNMSTNQYVNSLENNTFYRINDATYFKQDHKTYELEKNEPIVDVDYYRKGVLSSLSDIFGYTINQKGFKELDSHIGIVYGDGMNCERINKMYEGMLEKGYAANNICIAAGAYILSYSVSRDSLGLSTKASQTCINQTLQPVYKMPITDYGKKSPAGFLNITSIPQRNSIDKFYVKPNTSIEEESRGLLKVIFKNGELFNQNNYQDLREVVKKDL